MLFTSPHPAQSKDLASSSGSSLAVCLFTSFTTSLVLEFTSAFCTSQAAILQMHSLYDRGLRIYGEGSALTQKQNLPRRERESRNRERERRGRGKTCQGQALEQDSQAHEVTGLGTTAQVSCLGHRGHSPVADHADSDVLFCFVLFFKQSLKWVGKCVLLD